jgi:2-polyprenyl-3-methyl-5-hydroxy-6-metoxy-1,4-benzoquinol methylase
MIDLKPLHCPITDDSESRLVFHYTRPPAAEVSFPRPEGEPYLREVWQFLPSGHFVSIHRMQVDTNYSGSYVDSTYKNEESMRASYRRIIGLPPERSDNFWRFSEIKQFANSWFGRTSDLELLDIGSGLGVFPSKVHKEGWLCTALDPDERAVKHLADTVGVNALLGDFMKLDVVKQYDIITLNKVLEHVYDPIAMLRRTYDWLKPGGFVYVEVPDGEIASRYGSEREEFTIEHLHVFSLASSAVLATQAGYLLRQITRVQEPSSKYTLRLFLTNYE